MVIFGGSFLAVENIWRCENLHVTSTRRLKVTCKFSEPVEFPVASSGPPKMALFAGTHNEDSSYLLMDLAKTHNIKNNDNRLWFGQLFGMSDHISYNLANQGYNVAKYLPFGPVRDVMPYLIRRAEENTSVAGQTSRELNLLKTERKRRKL